MPKCCCELAYASQQGGLQFRNLRKSSALGCGSAAARTPLLPFPRSRAGCISGLIGVFARRREPLKRLHSVGANIFGLSQGLSVPIFMFTRTTVE